ncbi:hypothetical protein TNCT_599481 [Trichonephila clavata]|uniref:Uncharacterized protein n=1 Tax=Trichonephila clavata TaxID=2740835 RepID=A0A8X6HL27_TRICU|nr:hypothetical protein TNCT_599481 [Trichonephila clavata]
MKPHLIRLSFPLSKCVLVTISVVTTSRPLIPGFIYQFFPRTQDVVTSLLESSETHVWRMLCPLPPAV